jgi:hypothetical protein
VDLISAKIPNTVYNLTTSSNVISFESTGSSLSSLIAVGHGGATYNVQTSPDGVDWTGQIEADPSTTWRSVTWSGTQFVAVGYGGATYNVQTSPDGVIWTGQLAADPSTFWNSVTWSGTQFVAVGGFGATYNVQTSPDGVIWTGQTAADPGTSWRSVTWSGTQFVAVGGSGGTYRVQTSPNGVDWTGQIAAESITWSSVTWSGTQFVAVGYGGGTYKVQTSPDGVIWTGQIAADPSTFWNSVTWSGTQFVAVGYGGATYNVQTSPNGVDWTGQTPAISSFWNSVTWSGTQFVAVGGFGATYNVMTSPNGVDWTGQIEADPITNWQSVTYRTINFSEISNVALNPGFYSTDSLVSTFNNSEQVSNVAMSYLEAEGKFIFTGNFASVTTLTHEIAEILGLPLGTTLSSPIATNAVYQGLYPTASAYVVSSNIVSLEMNDYIWLDIEEFRTPFTTDARKLVLNPQGVYTTTSNTSARSFAIIPMDVPSGGIKSFREAADYPVYVTFPSRLDSLDRLTIKWLNRDGVPLDFHGLDVNSFTLRLHTVHVPDEVERPVSLPPPVPFEKENQKVVWGAMIALVIGLMLIILAGKKK